MSDLANQAGKVILACRAAMTSAEKDPPDLATVNAARTIVHEAKRQLPTDPLLQAVNLDPTIPDWSSILRAMQLIVLTLRR